MDIKANKLKTILQFSIPSVIAMVFETVITITDGYFTGNYIGEDALAAINLGLPILYFYLGIGLCVGVGGTVICGKMLGEKDSHRASQVFSQTIVATLDKGKHKNNNKMDCQPYRKRRPAMQKGGVFAWQGKEENVPRDGAEIRFLFRLHLKK